MHGAVLLAALLVLGVSGTANAQTPAPDAAPDEPAPEAPDSPEPQPDSEPEPEPEPKPEGEPEPEPEPEPTPPAAEAPQPPAPPPPKLNLEIPADPSPPAAGEEGDDPDATEEEGDDDDATEDDDAADDGTEEIVVTGSRIKRSSFAAAAAVQVIDRKDLEYSGATNLADVVQYLTVAQGSGFQGGAQATGTVSVNLRGLGTGATLVLLNGRRVVSSGGGIAFNFTDISTIPLAVVERIEILKGGASAIYGSDAVGGVINIITRKDWDGARIEVDGSSPLRLLRYLCMAPTRWPPVHSCVGGVVASAGR